MSLVSNCVRYVDVAAGLGLLVSQSCLVWGVRAGGRIHQVKIVIKIVTKIVIKIVRTVKMLTPSQVLAFFLLSTLVLLGYWGWWAVLYCSRTETEASQEVTTTSICSVEYIKTLC